MSSQLPVDVLKTINYELYWLLKQQWAGREFRDLRGLFYILIKSGSVVLKDHASVLKMNG